MAEKAIARQRPVVVEHEWRSCIFILAKARLGENLKIAVAGSGGAALTKERSCSCVLVDETILLDCGCGSLKNLRVLGMNLHGIERILLSHLHNDHVGDLASILWTMQIEGRTTPLEICGPGGTSKFIGQMLKLVRTPKGFLTFKISSVDLIGNLVHDAFSWCRGNHVPESRAYRIGGDATICYSGDTRPLSRVARLAKHADLLIHDSAFTGDEHEAAVMTKHSTASEAGQVAKRADVSLLMLFHILGRGQDYEDCLRKDASKVFGGAVLVGQDLVVVSIPRARTV